MSKCEEALDTLAAHPDLHPRVQLALQASSLCYAEQLPVPRKLTLPGMILVRANLRENPNLPRQVFDAIANGAPPPNSHLGDAFNHWLPDTARQLQALVNHEAENLLVNDLCQSWPKVDVNSVMAHTKLPRNLVNWSVQCATAPNPTVGAATRIARNWYRAAGPYGNETEVNHQACVAIQAALVESGGYLRW